MTPVSAPGGDPAEPDEQEAPAPTERRRRLQDLAGLTVRGSDGGSVGRVRDVYQLDASAELAAITVVPRQLSSRSVLIPAAAIASLPPDPEDREEPADGERSADGGPAGSRRRDAKGSSAAPAIELRIDVSTAKAGARPPLTGHLGPEELRDAAAVLGLAPGRDARPDGPQAAGVDGSPEA